MKNRFTCPPSFDAMAASILSVSKDFKQAYVKAKCDEMEIIPLQDAGNPDYGQRTEGGLASHR